MASKMADSFDFCDDLLNCSICFDAFKDPKVLPCLHTFCQDCIHRHYENYKLKNAGRLSCPTCRELIPLPQKGVPGFRNDVTIPKTREILKELGAILSNNDNNNGDTGACGGGVNVQEAEKKREEVKSAVKSMQNILVKIRGKILQMYLVEVHVKLDLNSKKNVVDTSEKSSKKRIKLKENLEEKSAPSLAQLATEQDRLYQSLVELKSVHDVLEEFLEKANLDQFDLVYPEIHRSLVDISPFLEKASPLHQKSGLNSEQTDVEEWAARYVLPALNKKEFHLQKNPDKVGVRLLHKIGCRGSGPGCFDFPVDGTFTPDGGLVICDKNNLRLQLFNSKGDFMKELLKDEIKPRRICLNPRDGLMYVSDELAECIKVFSPRGQLVHRFGDTVFQCPAGMGVDSKGNLVLTDAEKCFVSLHQPDGTVITKFYYRYLSDKLIPNPYYATSNDDNQLIVSDFRNNIVKVFSNTGQVLFKIEKLNCPRGVCMDPYGNILVAEGDAHRISMYSPYGKFMCHLVTAEDGLYFPLSIDMNMSGTLMVTQCGYYSPHEVLVFQVY